MRREYSITPENKLCFFGYYDKCPWDINEKYFLFHQVDFQDRPPEKNDKAKICILELNTRKTEILDETYAWNFQQGAMLQWLDEKRIIYNNRIDNQFVSVIQEITSGKKRIIPKPVSAVSSDGKYGLSINFSRLARWRPGYGYEGGEDIYENEKWPENDGIYFIDLESGKYKLIVSLSEMLNYRKEENVENSYGWFNHTLFSPDGKRFIFLNRWKKEGDIFKTRIFTSDISGKEKYDLLDTYLISHFDWKNEKEFIVWAEIEDKRGFWIVEDKTGKYKPVSERIQEEDGHCSYSKNERFILLDTYPIENYRYLKIFDTETEKEIILGKFYSLPEIKGEIRCDLHPRWSRSEKFISFDSIHEGYRRVYIMDISEVINSGKRSEK